MFRRYAQMTRESKCLQYADNTLYQAWKASQQHVLIIIYQQY